MRTYTCTLTGTLGRNTQRWAKKNKKSIKEVAHCQNKLYINLVRQTCCSSIPFYSSSITFYVFSFPSSWLCFKSTSVSFLSPPPLYFLTLFFLSNDLLFFILFFAMPFVESALKSALVPFHVAYLPPFSLYSELMHHPCQNKSEK